MSKYFILFLALSISGCAGNKELPLSSRHLEAISHNQRGILAEAKLDNQRALQEFGMALQIYTAIDNNDGIIVSLINLSRVFRHKGESTSATNAINRAIPLIDKNSPLMAEVAFEKGQTALLNSNLDEAIEWSTLAASVADDGKRAAPLNLLGRTLFLKNDVQGGEMQIRNALQVARKFNIRNEEANALRQLGEFTIKNNRLDEAAELYQQALEIDRTLGKSTKIATDLAGLARVALLRNENDLALKLYGRAYDVSSNSGNSALSASYLYIMSEIHTRRGEQELSENLLRKRQKLLDTQ